MTLGGTDAYRDDDDVPVLVRRAVELARDLRFGCSCRPEQGRLLQLLAAGRRGARIGETGTGCGVGLAWLWSGAGPETPIVSVERDTERATAAAALFADQPNITIVNDAWPAILAHGPFDLLVLDGGGTGKTAGDRPIEPSSALHPFGTLVIDDFTPLAGWPPVHDDRLDTPRLHWLEHRELLATEIVLHPRMSTIVATRRG